MILVAGLPASGKTSFAKSIASDKDILEFDDLAVEYGSYVDLIEERSEASSIFANRIVMARPSVVVDSFHSRMARIGVASLFPFLFDVVVVACPIDICIMRNKMRKAMVSNNEIRHMSMIWEPISLDEGFRSIWVYDSILNVLKCLDRRN